jgi:hypothetical protein
MRQVTVRLLLSAVILASGICLPQSASAAAIPLSALTGETVRFDVFLDTGLTGVTAFDFTVVVPTELTITQASLGALFPSASSTAFLINENEFVDLPTTSGLSSPFSVVGSLAAPVVASGAGLLFSIDFLSSNPVVGLLELAPSLFGPSLIDASGNELPFFIDLSAAGGTITASLTTAGPEPIPEPGTLLLVATGLATGVLGTRKRRRHGSGRTLHRTVR